MATIATIAAIHGTGSVYAVNAQGVQRLLKAGDALEKGETIRTVGDANVELLSEDMRALHINPDQVVKLDDNVFQTDQTPTATDAAVTTPATTNTIIQALENGQDLSTQLDATAAGLGDGGGGGGASFVQLTHISEGGINGNTYGYDFNGLGTPAIDPGVGNVTGSGTTTPTTTTTTSTTLTLTVDSATANEGGHVTYTVKLGAPATSDMTVTLSNGATIVVSAGSTTGVSQPIDVRPNDVYVEGNLDVQVTVTTVQGGGFDRLFLSDGNVVTTVGEVPADTSNVSLSVSGHSEPVVVANGSTVTVTAHVDHAPQTDLVITLNTSTHGAADTITIKAGELSGSTDVVAQGNISESRTGQVDVHAVSSTGGNYEDLQISGATATVTVTDPQNIATVTLSGPEAVNEGAGTAAITAHVDHAPQTDLVITLSTSTYGVADTITIKAGTLSGSTDVAIHGNTPVQDAGPINVSIVSTSGGSYEDLNVTKATASVQVNDTTDAYHVVISSAAAEGGVYEGTGTVAFTIRIVDDNGNPVGTNPYGHDISVTLADGSVQHIAASATSVSFNVPVPGNDAIRDGSTITQTISSVALTTVEGSTTPLPESLSVGTTKSASVEVHDTTDTYSVVISSAAAEGGVNEGSGTVAFTIRIVDDKGNPVGTNPYGHDISVTLADGSVRHIAADATSVSFNVPVPGNDAIRDGSTITQTISSVALTTVEGETTPLPESLTVGTTKSASVEVHDTTDAYRVVLTAVATVPEGSGTVTYTATLVHVKADGSTEAVTANPYGQDITVLLSDKSSITIPADGISATHAVAVPGDDVYNDASTLSLAVTGVSLPTGTVAESLTYVDAATTVSVEDTVDTTKITLGTITVDSTTGMTSISATLDHAPQAGSPLVVTLSNGATITFEPGHTTATSTAFVAPSATTTYSINPDLTSGGNFEHLDTSSTATLGVTNALIIGGPGDDNPLTGGIGQDIIVGDPGSSTFKPGQSANVVFVLDTSGSMTTSLISFTNSTGTYTETRLQALEDSVIATLKQLANSGAHVVVHLDQFSDTASTIGTFDLSVAGQLDKAIAAVQGLTAGGTTNYEAGLQSALNWINTTATADVNKVVFVSDGQPNALNNNTDSGSETTSVQSSTGNQAIAAALGTLSASGSIHADHVSEVAAIAAMGYDLQAVGINVGNAFGTASTPTARGFLSELEGYNFSTVTTGHTADNITTANQLASTIGTLSGSQTIETAAGSDVLHGGAGDDLIYGDAMNTDKLAAAQGLTGLYPSGSGSQVFTALENGSTGWTHTDTLNYIQTHADELGAESGRSGGNDVLYGDAGNDRIYGQEGNDVIDGGAGDDWIRGGTGNDTLTGGVGADVFAWSLGDQGTSSAKAVDHITDFQANVAGEALDLRDLLQGEHSAAAMDGTAASGSLTQFIKFDLTSDGKLEMLVTHDPVHSSGVTQAIVLDNFTGANVDVAKASLAHTLDASFNASSISDADLLKKLIDTGHLKTEV